MILFKNRTVVSDNRVSHSVIKVAMDPNSENLEILVYVTIAHAFNEKHNQFSKTFQDNFNFSTLFQAISNSKSFPRLPEFPDEWPP